MDEKWENELLTRNALNNVCQRVARVLTQDVRVVVESDKYYAGNAPAPAWLNGRTITLVHDFIRGRLANANDLNDRTIVTISLLFHELGHYRFTPPYSVWLNRQYRNPGANAAIKKMLNVVEDQRQELLMTTLFPKARDYFRLWNLRAMRAIIREKGRIDPENWILYWGRRNILPRPILKALEDALTTKYGATTVSAAKALIDEALTLNGTDDDDIGRLWDIAEEMTRLFPAPSVNPYDCLIAKTGSGRSKTQNDEAQEKSEKIVEQMQERDQREQDDDEGDATPEEVTEEDAGSLATDDDSGGDDEGDSASGSDEPDDSDEGADDTAGTADDDNGESDDMDADDYDSAESTDIDSDIDSEPEDGQTDDDGSTTDTENAKDHNLHDPHNGSGGQGDGGDDMLQEVIEEALKTAEEQTRERLSDTTEPYIDSVRNSVLSDRPQDDDSITASVRSAAERITRMFEQVNVDLGPTEFRNLRSGRLDSSRAHRVQTSGSTRVFRKRQEDLTNDAAMGVIIAFDVSGSMGANAYVARDVALSVARGAENAGHKAKVVAFGSPGHWNDRTATTSQPDQTYVVKGWDQRLYSTRGLTTGGGTPIMPTLNSLPVELHKLYNVEEINHSVLFIVTDGQYDEWVPTPRKGTGVCREQRDPRTNLCSHGYAYVHNTYEVDRSVPFTCPVRSALAGLKRRFGTHVIAIGIGIDPEDCAEYEQRIRINNIADLNEKMQSVMGRLARLIAQDVARGA